MKHLILKSLELQGFKSFPDKIKIEFGSGITAIVGPNGSGKSNVSDAIRWVLGEQSNKTLRSSKMEDVIFTGTTKRKPQGFAQVSLTIDNSDRALPVDYGEVTVTRRYYRSGESEYFINKTQSRLKDIHELFMDTGIGRDGYSIIGQGRIAEILSNKSEDRRQIIEEVAGISKFRYRKNEAQRKLSATEENLVRLQDIAGELEDRLPALESQSNKAKKYLVMYDEKKNLEISLWISELEKIRISSKELEDKFNIAKGSLEDITVEIDNLEGEINSVFEKNRDINIEIEQVRSRLSGFEEKKGEIASRIAVLEAGIQFETENISKIENELRESGERENELRAMIDARIRAIEEKNIELTELEKSSASLAADLENVSRSGEEARREAQELSTQRLSLSENKNALNIQKISCQASRESKSVRRGELTRELETRRSALLALSDEQTALKSDIDKKTQQRTALLNTVSGYRKMLEIKQRRYDEKKAELRNAQSELEGKEQNLKILSDMEKHLDGFAGSVRAVLENSRRGTLPGVLGTVSQLIRVDKKYIVAVETALGNAVQNIVTDNAKTAKSAMLLLKNNRAGRATFLPLTEINPRPASKIELRGRGIIGLAHELVQTSDEAGKKAAQFLLGRTVVCETIDDAIDVSRKMNAKYKTVTLDGQVVNPGGSMTGGSTAKSAGLLSRSLEIERLEKEIAALRENLGVIESGFVKCDAEKNELTARLDGANSEIRVLDEELNRLNDLCESKNVVADSFNELIDGCERELKSLSDAFESDSALIESLDSQMSELNKNIEGIDSLLSSLTGKTEDENAQIEKLQAQLAQNDMSKMSIFKDIEAQKQVIEQLESQLSGYGDRTRSKTEQIAAARVNIENNQKEIAHLNDDSACMEKMQQDGSGKINELIAARNELEAQQTAFRTKQRDSLAMKERLLQETTRLENRISGISEQSGRIIERLSEYELTVTEANELAKPLDDESAAKKRVAELKSSIRTLGSVNIEAIEEYKAVKERFDFLDGQMTDLKKSKTELEKIIRELLLQMTRIFTDSFERLNAEFGKTFAEMFGGGKGELILLDPDDVLNCGIDIRVAPPGKIIKNIVALSGGEQAFTAIALYFAILRIRPTPFCIMDEIEAALDDVNVNKFASKLRDFCDKTQFIVITHRRGTMEEADVLYGVTMQEKGISKMLTIDVNEMERQLKL